MKYIKLFNEAIYDNYGDILSLCSEYGIEGYGFNLEEVFNTLNMDIPEDIKFKNYEIH